MTTRIKNTGKTQRRVMPGKIAKALGAEEIDLHLNPKRGTISLFMLRQLIVNKLRSNGGRPSLIGAQKNRTKIPLIEEDWSKLKEMSKYFKVKEGMNVSPSQLASILIHKALDNIQCKF
jgi:hypothetical protein